MAEEQEERMLVDKLRPTAELALKQQAVVDVKAEERIRIGDALAEMLKEEGVEYIPFLTGGNTGIFIRSAQQQKIKCVHVRHEQTAGFFMSGWGTVTRRPTLAMHVGGTGLTNFSTGLVQAYSSGSPGVALSCETGLFDDDKYGNQGLARAENQFRGICKWVRKVSTPNTFLWQMKRAFRSAVTPPTGPVSIAVAASEINPSQNQLVPRRVLYQAYRPGYWKPDPAPQQYLANPVLVERAVKWLMEAERPVLIAGSAAHMQDCQEELREFAHLLGVPSSGRRTARGIISELDDLNYGRRARGPVFDQADRCIVFGLRIGVLEGYGNPPFFPHKIRYCQIQDCPENTELNLPTDIEIYGNLKQTLKQMIQVAKDMGVKKPVAKWEKWRQFVKDTEASYKARVLARTDRMAHQMPVHPDLVGRYVSEVMSEDYNNDCISIIDGFTASAYFTAWNIATNSGHNLDASETIGIGHSFGLALACGLATNRSKPIFAILGDGAVGAAGMDVESCVRWNIPAVFLHENNNTLINGMWELYWSKTCAVEGNILHDSWETMPWIHYEKMFAEVGAHPEFVERPEQLKPAVKRAFEVAMKEKRPAFVEVFVDMDVIHSTFAQPGSIIGTSAQFKWDELPDKGKRMMATQLVSPAVLPRLPKDWQEGIASFQKK
ncbi:MAG: thiamine pyrophosphate-binding protein [Chloroflexota bacterium]